MANVLFISPEFFDYQTRLTKEMEKLGKWLEIRLDVPQIKIIVEQ